jgi:putative ABC transport system permease protein
VRRTVERVIEEARKESLLESTAVSTGLPFGVTGAVRLTLTVPDAAAGDSGAAHAASAIAATPSIFRTIGAPILRGRGFDDRDVSGAPPVVVLSEFTARRIFGTADAVGRRLLLGTKPAVDPLATVIGIARDTDVRRLLGEPRPFVYLPLAQHYDPFLTIVARANGDASLAVRAVRDAIRRAEPDAAIDAIGTGRSVLSGPYVLFRPAGLAALALGGLTLLLAMVGLFGIQSHIVSHRTREIGVRMSFGATKAQIERMVLKDGCRPVLEGLAIGLFLGLAGRAIVRANLEVEMPIIDPWMVVGVPIPLLVAAFCACYVPAHRASAVDPNVALRHL